MRVAPFADFDLPAGCRQPGTGGFGAWHEVGSQLWYNLNLLFSASIAGRSYKWYNLRFRVSFGLSADAGRRAAREGAMGERVVKRARRACAAAPKKGDAAPVCPWGAIKGYI